MEDRFAGIGRRIVVATHRRSGTHLTLDLLRRQLPACRARKRPGEGLDTLYLNLDHLGTARQPLSEERALELLARAPRPLVKTHALAAPRAGEDPHAAFRAALLADADLYCVVRDGRDVICSLFAYVGSYDPHAPASLSEFLRQEERGESRVARWARDVRATLARPGVRHLAYEDLVRKPRQTLERLGRELGLTPLYREPLLPRARRGAWSQRLGRLARNPESTAIPGGRGPDWRSAFTAADRAFFQREAGELLIELGYESSPAWVEELAA